MDPKAIPEDARVAKPSPDDVEDTVSLDEDDDLSKSRSACGAQPGAPCFDVDPDGARRESQGAFHAARVFGPGPVVVRHTGRYNEDGGGVFEVTTQADA
jgi:hypothetical protein